MKMKHIALVLSLFSITMFTSCKDEDPNGGGPEAKGTVQIEMTDAPIDDTNISGTFITVLDVKVGDVSLESFSKTTFDVMALRNGLTKVLGKADLEPRTYSSITLVLDYDTDADGNAPGCYVAMTNGEKAKLETTVSEVVLDKSFTIVSEQQTNLVIDFDLRKCLARETGGTDNYNFVTATELKSGIRVVTKGTTGNITGTVSDNDSNADKVVVFAYKLGTYNSNETNASGASQIKFRNAVSSATVDANGEYYLTYLEEGQYQVVLFSYEDADNDGTFEAEGKLKFNVLDEIKLNTIGITANATAEISVNITGIDFL